MNKEIPIFFSTDDNYIPYLDVAVSSLIANASKEFNYRIIVLNTGLEEANVCKVKQNEREGFKIDLNKQNFGQAERLAKEATAREILEHAIKIVESDNTFASRLSRN